MSWISDLFNKTGGGIVKEIGDAVGQFVTTDKERLELQTQLETIVNTRINDAATAANNAYQIEVDDRKSAREMATANPHSASTISMVAIGGVVVVAFLALMVGLIFFEVPVRNERVLDLLIGTLAGAFMSIVGFYFGSSAGAKANSQVVQQIAKSK